MLFPQLDKYKGQSQDLDTLINSTTEFLSARISENTAVQFDYRRFAGEVNISIELALMILEICAKEKILEIEYSFSCPEGGFVESYKKLSDVPQTLECWYHDSMVVHNMIDCDVQILFSFNDTGAVITQNRGAVAI